MFDLTNYLLLAINYLLLAIMLLLGAFLFYRWISNFLNDFHLHRAAAKILMAEFPENVVIEGRSSHRKINLERKTICGCIYFVPDPREVINEDGRERLLTSAEIACASHH